MVTENQMSNLQLSLHYNLSIFLSDILNYLFMLILFGKKTKLNASDKK